MLRTIIFPASSPQRIDAARVLFEEYAEWLAVDLCFQSFAEELRTLPEAYAPPRGRLLLAEVGGAVAGSVALRPLADEVCEMKRLYVRPAFRGAGLGRALSEQIIAEARAIGGYRVMRLDTLPQRMPAAGTPYRSLGFHPAAAYDANPLEGVEYLELELSAAPPG
jgi:GNAT superfamily N-acetyltransferase